MNSRDKGKRGELELAAWLRDRGIEARRGVQFHGGADSPDVVTSLPGVHFEVKRVERGSFYAWLAQAQRDAGVRLPVVAHRRNRGDWIAILPLEALIPLLPRDPAEGLRGDGGEHVEQWTAPEIW